MDLMGPTQIESIARKKYVYVGVDYFSRFTWENFLITKFEAIEELWERLFKEHNNRFLKISRIRSDHGKELKNSLFEDLYWKNGKEHEFLAPKTPQQNGVVERKNRTLKEMARVMLKVRSVPTKFWVEVVNTIGYISNRVYLRPRTLKT